MSKMLEAKDVPSIIANAEHYKAVGQTRIYIFSGKPRENGSIPSGLPWEYVTEVKVGGTYRMDLPVSVHFSAAHPCGLTLEWNIDTELRDSNGRGGHYFDIELLTRIAGLLPERTRDQLAGYVERLVDKVDEEGKRALVYAQNTLGQAAALEKLAQQIRREQVKSGEART